MARFWGGLSFEQIAVVAGCSASTAFRRYTAGVESLREKLGVTCPSRVLESLIRFTPDPGGLNRDALLFAAGRGSARASRGWKTLASVLAGTQALSLVLLLGQPAPRSGQQAAPVAGLPVPRDAWGRPPAAPPQDHPGIWSVRQHLEESEPDDRLPTTVSLIESDPPLRIFTPARRRSRTELSPRNRCCLPTNRSRSMPRVLMCAPRWLPLTTRAGLARRIRARKR